MSGEPHPIPTGKDLSGSLFNTEVHHPDLSLGKDLLPSYEECSQQEASSCQRLQGLPHLQKAALLEVMPFRGSSHPMTKGGSGIKAHLFCPDEGQP